MDRREDKRRSVGLSGLQSQFVRKVAKKGFEFTLMVAGEAGLGKSTIIETLFMEESERTAPPPAAQRIPKTTTVSPRSLLIQDNGLQLKLNIIDTPGFSDAIDNRDCFAPLVEYLDDAFLKYLKDETRLDRKSIVDGRVHCLLYFINPTSYGLKPVDVAALKALQKKVNIVPVIGKSDTLTKAELSKLKTRVREDIKKHQIAIFSPAMDEDDEADVSQQIMATLPFALVGSNDTYQVAGSAIRGRMYPWGIVEVDNPDHCDFSMLRDMIVRTHLNDMKDYTTEVLYEEFRRQHLRDAGGEDLSQSLADESRYRDQAAEITRMQEMKQHELEQKEAEIRAQLEELERHRQRLASSASTAVSASPRDSATKPLKKRMSFAESHTV